MKSKVNLILFSFWILLFTFDANAQIRTGIKAGASFAKVNFDLGDFASADIEVKNIFTFQAGVVMEFPLFDMFHMQSGLLYTGKGYGTEIVSSESNGEFSFRQSAQGRFNYLEVPFNFTYKESGFIFYAGPYVAFGIGGKGKFEQTLTMLTINGPVTETDFERIDFKPVYGNIEDADIGPDEDGFRGLDYGLNGGFGYEFGPLLLSVNYSFGLGNLNPKNDFSDDIKTANRVISFGVTYFFDSNKNLPEEK